MFKQLYKAGLYVKVEKCKFYFESVEYLGYIHQITKSKSFRINQNQRK